MTTKTQTEKWPHLKRLGLMQENTILNDNEPTFRGVVVGIIFLVVMIPLIATAITTPLSIGSCANEGHLYGLPHHWTPFYGCFLKLPDGHWIQDSAYRAFQQVHR